MKNRQQFINQILNNLNELSEDFEKNEKEWTPEEKYSLSVIAEYSVAIIRNLFEQQFNKKLFEKTEINENEKYQKVVDELVNGKKAIEELL